MQGTGTGIVAPRVPKLREQLIVLRVHHMMCGQRNSPEEFVPGGAGEPDFVERLFHAAQPRFGSHRRNWKRQMPRTQPWVAVLLEYKGGPPVNWVRNETAFLRSRLVFRKDGAEIRVFRYAAIKRPDKSSDCSVPPSWLNKLCSD